VWLEENRHEPLLLIQMFRGSSKSTTVSIFEAWELRANHREVMQIWGADKTVAAKMSRYTRHVLARHPMCDGMIDPRAPKNAFFVNGHTDARNPSMEAIGIDQNATGSRSTCTIFDDIEVPKNIRTEAKREGLRDKTAEAIHILVPKGRRRYIGTPHTHDTIYQEVADEGAKQFIRPLFSHHKRCRESTHLKRFAFPFKPNADGLYVFIGHGKKARLLIEGRDYKRVGQAIEFAKPPMAEIDIYAGNIWPERFDRADLLIRRKACRTINTWDSQYQLKAKAITATRLDPDRMTVYDVEPNVVIRNRTPVMMLGKARIAGFMAWWDVSLGKVKSDASALSIVLADYEGRLYWHRAVALTGDLEVIDERNKKLVDGQVYQLIETLRQCHIHHVHIEVNGPGGFVPAIARKHCKPVGITVGEKFSSTNKQARILDAFEPPLKSRFIWCHESVKESPAYEQMRGFDPKQRDQPDDYLDSGAGAILETPIRLERIVQTEVAAAQMVVKTQRGNQNASVQMDD